MFCRSLSPPPGGYIFTFVCLYLKKWKGCPQTKDQPIKFWLNLRVENWLLHVAEMNGKILGAHIILSNL